jgi:hypothetical protein
MGHRGIAAGRGNGTIDVTKRENLSIIASRCWQDLDPLVSDLDPLVSSVSFLPKPVTLARRSTSQPARMAIWRD